jgi:hypothetical protein
MKADYLAYLGIGLTCLFFLATCDGCDEATDETEYEQSSDFSSSEKNNISLSSINTDAIELQIELKYNIDHVKITEIEQIESSPIKLKFRFDYDSVQGRLRGIVGVCTLYDDGEIDEVNVVMLPLVPSRF